MITFLVTLGVLLLVVAGMAVGVLMGREPIKGSCGGLNVQGLEGECPFCGREEACDKNKGEGNA